MKIVSIFGNNLFAFQYTGEQENEFKRLFNLWADPEYLEEFFEQNKADIANGYFGTFSIEGAIFETYEYAEYLEEKLLALAEQSEPEQLKGLEQIFTPLHNTQIRILDLNQSKARYQWLRLYALRVEKNVYIITGGAIKLTQSMQEKQHTLKELRKIQQCRNYLLKEGIVDVEGIIEEIES
ncbi:hypothetical protein MNBD_BACTEROID01-1335 [hydrothermal vent metagenome]|uniref:Uncharacterized protein n=1 Tax=hydrothermal vent metagenome TaxID=652676 RepID=A0A3B0TX32_9ZZZZ